MKVLVTGCAGFIGSHVSKKLLAQNITVIGIDILNDYYDVQLKKDRLKQLKHDNFTFIKEDIANKDEIDAIFKQFKITHVINLAAQAGVRYSIDNPWAYLHSNLTGFLSILEACRHNSVKHLVYASSSSVYGGNNALPFNEEDSVDHPLSFYAATKKSNEMMAHSYSHLYKIPSTGLRFFTVYGPWGRPDMSPILFADKIYKGEQINVFNYGNHTRDFTYIDDIVQGVVRIVTQIPRAHATKNANATPNSSSAPFKIYNIGNNQPIKLLDYIHTLEKSIGKKAKIKLLPLQKGDVLDTLANVDDLMAAVGFSPNTDLQTGIHHFIKWYEDYYL